MRLGHSSLMLAGLVVGVALEVAANFAFGDASALRQFVRLVTEPAGKIFLLLRFVLVLPLIVPAPAPGVSGLGDLKALGDMLAVMVFALLLGAGLAATRTE